MLIAGIAGGTVSGKTTVVNKIVNCFPGKPETNGNVKLVKIFATPNPKQPP